MINLKLLWILRLLRPENELIKQSDRQSYAFLSVVNVVLYRKIPVISPPAYKPPPPVIGPSNWKQKNTSGYKPPPGYKPPSAG